MINFRFLSICFLILFSMRAANADCVFVNTNSDPNTVAAFSVNADGSLTAVAGSPFATGGSGVFDAAVGSAALLTANSRLYVSNPSSDNVTGFDIAADCTLTTTPGSPYAAGSRALGLEADPQDAFLYVANFLGDNISVFAIAADGSLTQIAGSPFATPSTPFDISFDPAGGRFFVSHDFAGAIGVYDQAADGTFTPVAGSPFAAGGFEHGLFLNAVDSRVYIADFGPDTISGFSIDASGVLTPLPGSPYAAGVEPITLQMTPDRSFLYATNDNAENIAGFSIAANGDLTALAGSPFASDSVGPAGMAQDPAGSYLFVANGGFSGNADVSVFTVAGDGSITPIAGSPFATGGTGNATGIAYFITPVDGVCGNDNTQTLTSTPVNLCSAGTASAVSGNGPWTWSCQGAGSGTTDSCNANIQSYPITANINPISAGTASCTPNPVNHNDNSTCNATANAGFIFDQWSGDCIGATCTLNNVTAAQTVTANFLMIINGVCGTDNGQSLTTTPTQLCSAGTASAVAGTGSWTWSCAGENTGTTASCSAALQTFPVSITVSPSAAGTVTCNPDPIPSNSNTSCSATANAGFIFDRWSGDCSGATCDLFNILGAPSITANFLTNIDGVCGTDNGQQLISTPTQLCTAGTASTINGRGPWNWSCLGSNTGINASCSAQRSNTLPQNIPSLSTWGLVILNLIFGLFVMRHRKPSD